MKFLSKYDLKKNKGFTTTDIVISIIIIVIFIGTITTLFYNYYLSTAARNRNAIAINCMIDVIEHIKVMKYDDVNSSTINLEVEKLRQDGTIPSPYIVTVELEKYNETPGNTDKEDLIKLLKVTIEYTVGEKLEKQTIQTLLTK